MKEIRKKDIFEHRVCKTCFKKKHIIFFRDGREDCLQCWAYFRKYNEWGDREKFRSNPLAIEDYLHCRHRSCSNCFKFKNIIYFPRGRLCNKCYYENKSSKRIKISEEETKLKKQKRRQNFFKTHPPYLVNARGCFNKYCDGNLSFENFMFLSQQKCAYCKKGPSNVRNKYYNDEYAFIYNGLDRIDSSKPHDLENIVSCCISCNRMKSDQTMKEFTSWLKRFYSYQNKI